MNTVSVPAPANDSRQPVSALILAAGKGTRMKSDLAKVLHPVYFKPMVHHVLDCVTSLDLDNIILITGHQADAVETSCAAYPLSFVRQEEQLGTGHAVLTAEPCLKEIGGVVMILCGDTPLINPERLGEMLQIHLSQDRILTVGSTLLDDPTNYGRLITDSSNLVKAIVEEKDATAQEKEIVLINTGIYCVNADFLFKNLKDVGTENAQGEVYLTDIVSLANRQGYPVYHFGFPDPAEVLGVNSRVELAQAHGFMQKKYITRLMAEGVTVNLPETVTVEPTASIAEDTVINPNVYISGKTTIGRSCLIESFSYIADSRIGDNVTIEPGVYLQGANIESGQTVASDRRHC